DPGQALQQLELAILRQDPALTAPQATLPAPRGAADPARVALAVTQLPTVAPRDPARLPRPTTPTFGRDELVAHVREALMDRAVRSLTLTGPGGAGKSRVAVLAAAA